MKYIRVINDLGDEYLTTYKEHCEMVAELQDSGFDFEGGIIEQADTIEELCDVIVSIKKHEGRICDFDVVWSWLEWREELGEEIVEGAEIYGAIWTDEGLIYVAKMNEKGELELL